MINNSLVYIGFPAKEISRQFDFSYDWHLFLNSYKHLVRKEMTVLDIGSSAFVKTESLARYCKKLFGLELLPERIFNDFSNVEFLKGDWNNLTSYFPEKYFDIITSSHVIEHVKDDIQILNESYKVLKKGGYLLISTPNRKRLIRFLIESVLRDRTFPYHEHEREYVKEDIVKLIKKTLFANSEFSIKAVTFGLHGGPFWFYFKKMPIFLEKYSGFWHVIIKK